MKRGNDFQSLSLLTDLYQLTMGYGYWSHGRHSQRSAFHLFFRTCPFGGNHAISAGLATAVDWLTQFEVATEDVEFLATIQGNDGKPIFSPAFLDAINGMKLSVDIDAMPEGTIVFGHQPIVRVTGPLWQCQWIETALLNIINFQTLIATKASRVCAAASGDSVLEFGLRRAQGIDGALSASRAAYIGGCHATSNVLAGKRFGIPVKGTLAHSWVMSFDDEQESFEAYAKVLPNNCVFLVDTYDTIEGVKKAIEVGKQLRDSGHKMMGIRLDSGDLAQLSKDSRTLLDEAGFEDAAIVASNDLDEHSIAELKRDGATIAIWGVGTNLVTARDQPALGGVYKLAAIEDESGTWQPRIKLSESAIKTSIPGILQVRRYKRDGKLIGDVIHSELTGQPESQTVALDAKTAIDVGESDQYEDLLQPVLRDGKLVQELPSLDQVREYASAQRDQFAESMKDREAYPIGLEPALHEQKQALIKAARA